MHVHVPFLFLSLISLFFIIIICYWLLLSLLTCLTLFFLPHLPLPSLVATAWQEAVAKRLLVTPTLCYCFMELYKSEGKRLLILNIKKTDKKQKKNFFLPFLSVLFACIFPTFFLLLAFFLFPFLPPSLPPSLPPFLSRSVFGSLHVEGVWGYFTDTEGPVCGLPSWDAPEGRSCIGFQTTSIWMDRSC